MTIRDLIIVASSRLKLSGIVQARFEAESLLAHVLKKDFAWLLAHDDASLPPAQAKAFAKLVAGRTRRVPFAYLVGEQGFYKRLFVVTKDVLIPRPETELLVQAVLDRTEGNEIILDVGTGSGAIGLTLAAEHPKAKAILYDVSRKALAVAGMNAKRLKLGRRVSLAKLDVLKGVLPEPKAPAIIAANLPYLPVAAWKKSQPEVRAHEPKLALVSGRDGLDHYRALFKHLARWKRKPRLVALEAEPGQFETLAALALVALPDAQVEILKDLHGDERVLVAKIKNVP